MPKAFPTPGLLAALIAFPALAVAEPILESRIAGLKIAALSALPAAPEGEGVGEFCQHLVISPVETAGGKVAEAKGWAVTAEVSFGALTAVSFVGSSAQATSGTCDLLDGNVGFFAGDQLVSLIYATDPEVILIGHVLPFGDQDLRLWSGDMLPQPLADLQPLANGGVAVTALAALEPVCDGRAEVPLIYGLPIDQARASLKDHGWLPVPHEGEREGIYGIAPDLAAAGVPEVNECSGTGFGFCGYRYTGPAGTLFVTTVGEIAEDGTLPAVSDYGVDCQQ